MINNIYLSTNINYFKINNKLIIDSNRIFCFCNLNTFDLNFGMLSSAKICLVIITKIVVTQEQFWLKFKATISVQISATFSHLPIRKSKFVELLGLQSNVAPFRGASLSRSMLTQQITHTL